jgi:hypothetical protein
VSAAQEAAQIRAEAFDALDGIDAPTIARVARFLAAEFAERIDAWTRRRPWYVRWIVRGALAYAVEVLNQLAAQIETDRQAA